MRSLSLPDLSATELLAKEFAGRWKTGDIVLLSGPLGVGKTTFVRAMLQSLGFLGVVRSPTYNLIQTYATNPAVLHADFYRVTGAQGTGLEDYLETHLCLIEWPDRAMDLIELQENWRLDFEFDGEGRKLTIREPGEP